MMEALAIAICLGGLWSLLLLMTIVRLRDPLGHLHYREHVFERYRRQNRHLQALASGLCLATFMAVFCAVIFGHSFLLVPTTLIAGYLTAGIARVMRGIETMRFQSQDDDPCWQALALAMTWPLWSTTRLAGRI